MPFPTSLDSLATNKADGQSETGDHAPHHNSLATAVNALEDIAVGPTWYNVKGSIANAKGDGGTDDTAAIHRARDTAGTGGFLYFPPGTYLVNGLAANKAGQLWLAHPGATIKQANGGNGAALSITAADVTIDGGTWDGNAANQTSGQVFGISADRATLRNLIAQNGYTYGIFIQTANRARVVNCHVTTSQAGNICIFGQIGANDSLIHGCLIENSGTGIGAEGVVFHSTTGGNNVYRTRVIGNRIEVAGGFCVEIGAFSGDTPWGCVVANNTCVATGNSLGGISLSACNHSAVIGNTFDQNGFSSTIAGIEITIAQGCTCSGNVIRGGTGLLNGIDLDQAVNCAVTGNVVDGVKTASGIGIFCGTSAANNCHQNSITGNTVLLPAATTGIGIWLQANKVSQDVNNNVVADNIVIGPDSTHGTGITVELDVGTLSGTIVKGNQLVSLNVGINHASDTNGQDSLNVFSNVTTSYGGSSGAGYRRIDLGLGTLTGALTGSAAVLSSSPSGGVGYATGAGGMVTQATSKVTGVTLNTVSGKITLNNSSMASGEIDTFTLTNSAIAATDVLVLNHVSGGTAGTYALNAQAAAGSATINVRNNSGGVLAEAIVIGFAVVKAVTS